MFGCIKADHAPRHWEQFVMKTLSEVVDELNIARKYVECAFLASRQASDEVMHPLCAVCSTRP